MLKNMLKQPDCPLCFLKWAAVHGNEAEQLAVTMNPEAPVEVLEQLAVGVGRISVAAKAHINSNQPLPRKGLERVFDEAVRSIFKSLDWDGWRDGRGTLNHAQLKLMSPDVHVHWFARQPTDRSVRAACQRGDVYYLPFHKVEAACRRRSLVARLLGLIHRRAPVAALARRCTSEEWIERMAVARNTSSPDTILRRLIGDANRLVAKQAQLTLEEKARTAQRHAELLKSVPEPIDLTALVNELETRISARWAEELDDRDSHRRPNLMHQMRIGGRWVLPLLPILVERYFSEFKRGHVADVGGAERRIGSILEAQTKDLQSILARLAESDNPLVRRRAASSRFTPESILAVLAKDKSVIVRRALAINPATSSEILAALTTREDFQIQQAILAHPNCSADLLVRIHLLSVNRQVFSELSVTAPTTVQEIRNACVRAECDLEDFLWGISNGLLSDPRCPQSLLSSFLLTFPTEDVQSAVSYNPSCPSNLLLQLSASSSREVIERLAENPSCPSDVQARLAQHESADVRRAVAENTSCPPHILKRLVNDADPRVSSAARRISSSALPVSRTVELLDTLAKSDRIDNRLAAYRDPSATPQLLQQWVSDRTAYPLLRIVCLANPVFPHELIEEAVVGIFRELESPTHVQPTLNEIEAALWCLDEQDSEDLSISDDWVERAASTFEVRGNYLWSLLDDPHCTVSQLAVMQLHNDKQNSEVVGNEKAATQIKPLRKGSDGGQTGICPRCGAPVRETERQFECANSAACDFRVGKQILGRLVTRDEVSALLRFGKTDLLEGFISNRTKREFSAWLVLDGNGKVSFEFP